MVYRLLLATSEHSQVGKDARAIFRAGLFPSSPTLSFSRLMPYFSFPFFASTRPQDHILHLVMSLSYQSNIASDKTNKGESLPPGLSPLRGLRHTPFT